MSATLKGIAIGVVLLGVIMTTQHCYSSQRDEWETRVQVALVESENLRSRVVDLQSEADLLRSQAEAQAEEAAAREPVIIERIVQLPPAETPGEHVRDSIIVEVQEVSETWKLAYHAEREAHGLSREALFLALVRGDSLHAVLEDRPGKPPWWIPKLGVGAFGGSCVPQGTLCAGIGVGVFWEIGL